MTSSPLQALYSQIELALTGMFDNHVFTVDRAGIRYVNCTRQGLIQFPQGVDPGAQDYRWWVHQAANIIRSRQ